MAAGNGYIYLGNGATGPVWAPAEHAVLVLGPPRSGKTSSVVVPTVLGASGAVVSTSTKPDVLDATAPARGAEGQCFLYDPSGTVGPRRGVEALRWSPVQSCLRWDDAMLVTRALVGAGHSPHDGRDPSTASDHWRERAEALLSTLLHAAALGDEPMGSVLSWVDRHQPDGALGILDGAGAERAADLLAGIVATDGREQRGIWSTASGVLSAYRSQSALDSARHPDFDARRFCASSSTLYICAPARHQALTAPLVVGLLTEIRTAAYARWAEIERGAGNVSRGEPPVVLALDEVANIAPIPDLPAMVSEGGGQGLLTLACLQDLSQARARWGQAADGLLSLFGTTMVMAGIGDVRTLEALSTLAGDHEVATLSTTVPGSGPAGRAGRGVAAAWGILTGRRMGVGPGATMTMSTRPQRRLPVDALARGAPGMAVVVDERNRMGTVALTPWFAHEPWRSLALGRDRQMDRGAERAL